MPVIDISVLKDLVMVKDPSESGIFREMTLHNFKGLLKASQNLADSCYAALGQEANNNRKMKHNHGERLTLLSKAS